MKTILLAVNGMGIDQKALQYALTLCRPVRAGLDILQIVRPLADKKNYARIKKGVLHVREAFENAWTAAVYAEAGVPDLPKAMKKKAMRKVKRLLPKDVNTPVEYHCLVSGGDPDMEVIRYVNANRKVALAIYDTLGLETDRNGYPRHRERKPKGLVNRLPVPLIFVR